MLERSIDFLYEFLMFFSADVGWETIIDIHTILKSKKYYTHFFIKLQKI